MPAVTNINITSGTGVLSPKTSVSSMQSSISIITSGSGVSIFEGTDTNGNYIFKSLIAGTGINLTSSGKEITISSNTSNTTNGTLITGLASVAFTGSYLDLSNKPIIPTSIATALSNLTDVSISNPSLGQVLTYNGSHWIPSSITSGSITTALSNLTDVSITNPSLGQILTYNGSRWAAANSSSISLPIGTPQSFCFDVSYSNGLTSPSTINLPTGWVAITSSTNISITHNLNKIPTQISFHQSVVAIVGGIPTATSSFIVLSIPYQPPAGGYIQYDSINLNQISLINFTAANINFNNANITGAVVRVYITFI